VQFPILAALNVIGVSVIDGGANVKRSRRIYAAIGTGCVAVAVLAACSSSKSSSSDGGPGDIVIGVPLSLTGAFASLGVPDKNGIDLAVKDLNAKGGINGRKVTTEVLDDASDPTKAISNLNRLISDGVTAIVGFDASSVLVPASSVIARSGIFTVVPVAIDAKGVDGGPTLFGMAPPLAANAQSQLCYAQKQLGAKKIGLVQTTDAAAQAFLTAFKAEAQAAGLDIVASENVPPGTVDPSPALAKIRAANPDVIIDNGTGTTGAAIAKTARTLGIKTPIVGGLGWGQPTIIKAAGSGADGAIIAAFLAPLTPKPSQEAFVKEYIAAYNQQPAAFDTWSYDAINVVATALGKVPDATQQDGAKLQKAIEGVGIQGVAGNYTFAAYDKSTPANHAATKLKDYQFLVVQNGSLASAPNQPSCS
jgi:branched-chain amino acid transport system substrate-binding protein